MGQLEECQEHDNIKDKWVDNECKQGCTVDLTVTTIDDSSEAETNTDSAAVPPQSGIWQFWILKQLHMYYNYYE